MDTLLGNLESKVLSDPKIITFQTGRRYKQWNKNVIAIGLSSGFLEPLESTSIHLVQSAVVRLAHLFPHQGINNSLVDEFNKQSAAEFEQIRDFLVLHYHATQRTDSDFWQDMRQIKIPDSLANKIETFKQSGRLIREQNDLFTDSSWLQVMLGQGIIPQDYHPIANAMTEEQLDKMLNDIKK